MPPTAANAAAASDGREGWSAGGDRAWQPDPGEPITLSGGAAHSAVWREVIAAVTSRRVMVPAVPDATGLGAAMLAAVAVGYFSSPRAAAQAWFRAGSWTEPTEPGHSIYAAAYERFVALEAALTPLYPSSS